MKKVIWTLVIVVVIVLVGFFITKNKNKKNPMGLRSSAVSKGNIVVKALAIGQIVPKHEISVKSKIAGIVDKMYVEVGDKVQIGQELIKIKPDPTPIEYTQAKRGVELAEVSLKQAQQLYQRAQGLKEKSMISSSEFEEYENEYEKQKLQYQLANEKFTLLSKGKINLHGKKIESIIKSPLEGTILEISVNEGDPVVPLTSYQAGTSLMTMANMNKLIFKGTVDEIDIGKISIGTKVKLKIGALPDVEVTGEISLIAPKAKKDGNSTLFDVEAVLDPISDVTLRAGLSANAEIIIDKVDSVLTIPERLIQYQNDSAFVEVTQDTNFETIDTVWIESGLSDGMNTEIKSGLKQDDQIVERPPREIK